MSAGGLKYDTDKLRWDLLPMGALEEVAKVYSFGAAKYDSWNWRKGLTFSRCFAALMRHLYAWWWRGETIDQESGCHHLASVAFYVLNFLCYEQDGRQDLDDRPGTKTSAASPQPEPDFPHALKPNESVQEYIRQLNSTPPGLSTLCNTPECDEYLEPSRPLAG